MSDYDVVVIGAGAAGLSAGALLAAEGQRVLVTDRSPVLGGRAMAVPDEGFKVNVGGHLIEDPGSGLTKVFEHVGKELVHGATSAEMPVWDHEKQAWGSCPALCSTPRRPSRWRRPLIRSGPLFPLPILTRR